MTNEPCTHAKEMAQYAEDAAETREPWLRWQFLEEGFSRFLDCGTHPTWNPTSLYRRKPETFLIKGLEVPKPLEEPPPEGTVYYVPMPTFDFLYQVLRWDGGVECHIHLTRRRIHLHAEDAATHARAEILEAGGAV